MTDINTNNRAAQSTVSESPDTNEKHRRDDYPVGYGRPPAHTRFRPGQSGNPSGRRKGRRNIKTELKEIASKRITVRDGKTKRKVSLVAANILAHGIKGAQGDVRSSGLFLTNAQKMGLLDDEIIPTVGSTLGADQAGATLPLDAGKKSRASDELIERLNPDLLSEDEQIELSRLAEVMDGADGDFTELTTADFERLKHLVSKGRSKTITSH
jgi:hypothetical protein